MAVFVFVSVSVSVSGSGSLSVVYVQDVLLLLSLPCFCPPPVGKQEGKSARAQEDPALDHRLA